MLMGASAWPGALLAIAADERISLWQDVGYQTVGVFIVVGSLGFLAVVLTILGKFLRPRPAAATSLAGEAARLSATSSASGGEEITPELRAVIVAAVHETLGARHRVLDIETPLNPQQVAWSMEGRRQIFLSHRVR
jgi:Na+-transporting methylmalonyl-CoA/oxaloacetate decarboxylase gamma subunit